MFTTLTGAWLVLATTMKRYVCLEGTLAFTILTRKPFFSEDSIVNVVVLCFDAATTMSTCTRAAC